VVIHYEEALYQVYGPLPYLYLKLTLGLPALFLATKRSWYLGGRLPSLSLALGHQ